MATVHFVTGCPNARAKKVENPWSNLEQPSHKLPSVAVGVALVVVPTLVGLLLSSCRGQRVSGDPSMDAYSYYGPRHCPVSFASALEF